MRDVSELPGFDMPVSPLIPQRPPGRSTRKVSTYSAEIQRLQAEGYTLDAIREALADAGVVVSKSTVHREATRRDPKHPSIPPSLPSLPTAASAGTTAAGADGDSEAETLAPALPRAQRGRDIAAAFVGGRINNPLLRKDQQ